METFENITEKTSDTSEFEIHNIFVSDPDKFMRFVNRYVDITLQNNLVLSGTVYTIDPVSESIVLMRKEEDDSLSMEIVIKPTMKEMKVNSEVPVKQQNIITPDLFCMKTLQSPKNLCKVKEGLKSWLLKNMVPVEEDGDVLKMETLEIHPPYGADDCCCSNTIVLARVQTLIQSLPPAD